MDWIALASPVASRKPSKKSATGIVSKTAGPQFNEKIRKEQTPLQYLSCSEPVSPNRQLRQSINACQDTGITALCSVDHFKEHNLVVPTRSRKAHQMRNLKIRF